MYDHDEARLWRAVILQAFADATGTAVKSAAVKAKTQALRNAARAWLTKPTRDLFDVCRLAGEDINQVVDVAQKLAVKGWPDMIEGHHRTHILERHRHHGRRTSDIAAETEIYRNTIPVPQFQPGGEGGRNEAAFC